MAACRPPWIRIRIPLPSEASVAASHHVNELERYVVMMLVFNLRLLS
jgi:hypothetical protein